MAFLRFYRFLITVAFIIIGYFIGCDSPSNTIADSYGSGGTTTNNVTLIGTVVDAGSRKVMENALVTVNYLNGIITGYSGLDGKFFIQFNIEASKIVTIITTKTGYRPDTTYPFIAIGTNSISNPIALSAITSSGPPSAIYMLSQSATSLGVQNTGSPVTGRITFQVVDSLGNPIGLNYSSKVEFSFGARPNGGEFISPALAYTDSNGQATVALTSGIKSGVVQIAAKISLTNNRIITSQPTSFVIFGGLPSQDHFGIAPQYLNFAGYTMYGLQNTITAYLGDKYGNPVRPGTSVYFTTDGGIIEGSAQTSNQGICSVNLISAEPKPVHPTLGKGFASITASTADENSQTISKSIIVLFSGETSVNITSPIEDTFSFIVGGFQIFDYEVKDQNGNPLAPGTNISVKVDGSVMTSGQTAITMGDTWKKSDTKFSFTIKDTTKTTQPISVTITSTGPNGNNYAFMRGTTTTDTLKRSGKTTLSGSTK